MKQSNVLLALRQWETIDVDEEGSRSHDWRKMIG